MITIDSTIPRIGRHVCTTDEERIDLLLKVVRQIRAEPKRYRQEGWITQSDCGTAFCVAGWIVALSREDRRYVPNGIHGDAQYILGLESDDLFHLFGGGAIISRWMVEHRKVCEKYARQGHCDHAVPTCGTKEYAELGVRHIESFMREKLGYTGPAL